MNTPVKTKTTYFIDSGRLNAMYTLKRAMTGGDFYHEAYICNLSTDPDKAEQKARDYFDRVTARIQDTDQHETFFAGYADFELGQRRGKLSILDTERIERVESAVFPFGKHEGKKFSEVPESYVLFFADKFYLLNSLTEKLFKKVNLTSSQAGNALARVTSKSSQNG